MGQSPAGLYIWVGGNTDDVSIILYTEALGKALAAILQLGVQISQS